MNWTALGYQKGRHIPVGRSVTRLLGGNPANCYIPLIVCQKRASKHSKRRETTEFPLIAGIIFLRGEDCWRKAVEAQYTDNAPKATYGIVWRFPEAQILAFQNALEGLNDLIHKRSRANQDAPKVEVITLKGFSPDHVEKISARLFAAAQEAEQPLQARVA